MTDVCVDVVQIVVKLSIVNLKNKYKTLSSLQ